jgi:NADPH:quinone reductase-like Zn-dependent oxidoreductase
MKAIVYERYGPPDVLKLKDIDKPVPKDNEMLVKVMAATVNRTDCAMLYAKPFIMRFTTGLIKPKKQILGTEFAGKIESVGKNVTQFKPGDRIFGFDDNGVCAHAEYLTIGKENAIAIIPDNISYEVAATSTEGAHYAYNFVNKVKFTPDHSFIVNGASGGIGSATVQLLKHYKARITAVCNTKNLDLIKSLGAERIIDYLHDDFTKDDHTYDFVFDTVGKSTFGKSKSVLKSGGIYISSELGPWSQNLWYTLISSIFGSMPGQSGKKVRFPYPAQRKRSVLLIKELLENGNFEPVIDRKYPLEEIPDAFRYVEKGQKTGNVVITVSETE